MKHLEGADGARRILALPRVSVVDEHVFFAAEAIEWLNQRSRIVVLARDASDGSGQLRTYALLVLPVPGSPSELVAKLRQSGANVVYPQVFVASRLRSEPTRIGVGGKLRYGWAKSELHALREGLFSLPTTPFAGPGDIFSVVAILTEDRMAPAAPP